MEKETQSRKIFIIKNQFSLYNKYSHYFIMCSQSHKMFINDSENLNVSMKIDMEVDDKDL